MTPQFPIQSVRDQFPALNARVAFFDSPAGTQVPRLVIDAVSASFVNAASNYGDFFETCRNAVAINDRAREAMAELLGASTSREILIGQSTTMLTFQISRSLGRCWKADDEIIVTQMDHEANISPWLQIAEERGMTVRWLPFNRDTWRIEPADLTALLNDRTRLLALNYASNMTGSINPVGELTGLAGVDEARVSEGVVDARVYRRPGWVFGPFLRGSDRAGFVLATGGSRYEALANAGRAADLIRFETADAAVLQQT